MMLSVKHFGRFFWQNFRVLEGHGFHMLLVFLTPLGDMGIEREFATAGPGLPISYDWDFERATGPGLN